MTPLIVSGRVAQTPVLFELQETTLLPELVGEILRLGNDRQSFRWLQADGKDVALLSSLLGRDLNHWLEAA